MLTLKLNSKLVLTLIYDWFMIGLSNKTSEVNKMNTLKEMNLSELITLKKEWTELYSVYGAENFRQNALEVEKEILSRCVEIVEVTPVITVEYEIGYKWSVTVNGGESIDSQLTKAEAMRLARKIKRVEYKGKAVIEAQTLTKEERAENMAYLHEHTLTFATI
jgi:hypothetical protein